MPRTVQHSVHEPQLFPGAMDGIEATFACQSSPGNFGAGTALPARLASLRFASPIWISNSRMCQSRYDSPAQHAGGAARCHAFARIIEIVDARIAVGRTIQSFA
jgi:hypothetical protein